MSGSGSAGATASGEERAIGAAGATASAEEPEIRAAGATASGEERAIGALTASGVSYAVTRHGRVRSLEEAASARGVETRDIVKTLVVRRGEGDFLGCRHRRRDRPRLTLPG